MTTRRAFTLVELLVVIGIIALLIAILMPSLSKARKQAQTVQCLSQARNMAQAALLHATEHRGYMHIAGLLWGPYTGGRCDPTGLDDAQMKKYTYYKDNGVFRPAPLSVALAQYMNLSVSLGSRAEMRLHP